MHYYLWVGTHAFIQTFEVVVSKCLEEQTLLCSVFCIVCWQDLQRGNLCQCPAFHGNKKNLSFILATKWTLTNCWNFCSGNELSNLQQYLKVWREYWWFFKPTKSDKKWTRKSGCLPKYLVVFLDQKMHNKGEVYSVSCAQTCVLSHGEDSVKQDCPMCLYMCSRD